MTTPPKTTAQRQRAHRQKLEALGLEPLQIYAHRDDWQQIKAFAERLNQLRDQALVCVHSNSGA